MTLPTRNLFLAHEKTFVNGQHSVKPLKDPGSFCLVALPSSLASESSLFCWLMGQKRVDKAHLLLTYFVLVKMHIAFTHIQLVRKSHMTPPRCKGCWDM